ncbi:polysaccharide biosynthesis C-terminal domain-containing protein [Aequorivita soesokkakensis]|uniref:oligosaccharide flippase family protein n=1 Tax=Aequorivita soesokkakensis TaxID=1385699 RepID=UPI0010421247|nr:polysaccharide biosynthesis C-terminal domain-containing protein [Aequorivita soesokkakensis]
MRFKNIINSQNIKVSAVGNLMIKFLSAFFTLLTGILMASAMNIEGYGYYVLAFTTVTLLSIPLTMGLPNLIIRYFSIYDSNDQKQEMKGMVIRANQIIFFIFLIILILGYITYLVWWKSYNIEFVNALWFGFILLLFMGLSAIRAAMLTGLKYVVLGQIPDTILKNTLLCLGVFLYYISNNELSPAKAMIIHAIAAGISFVIGHYFLHLKLLGKIKGIKPIYHNKKWFREAIPFSLNSGVQVIRSKSVNYVLAIFGSVEGVAIYDIALRGAGLVSFTLTAINTAIAPYISSAFEKQDLKNLQNIITKTSRIIFVSAIPVTLIFILGGKSLIALMFGSSFKDAYIPLIIMCVGQLVSSIMGSVGLVLSMSGNQKFFTRNNLYITLTNIILSIPFIIYFDVIGAALITAILLIIQNITLFIYLRNKLKINTTIFR